MTIRVAIDLALDRLFDYSVPEALEKKLAIGQLLSVPFGHRTARGFALAFGAGRESLQKDGKPYCLKPILEIVDAQPFFSEKLLTLVKKLAAYTAAPIESVLRAAVPAAVIRPKAHAKELFYVEPAADDKLTALRGSLTARQNWLVDQVVRLGGGWLQPLCQELKTTPATLKVVAEKGALVIAPRQKRRDPLMGKRILPSRPLPLNSEQQTALGTILAPADSRPTLLFGVTGSGKTEVYLQAIAAELAAGRGAIVMVPEIALTPQTVQRFAARFGSQVAVLHSALSDGERYDEWHRIRSGEARVVVGPRSAVFAPVRNLGLIVVDEEHDASYKQEDNPRYHARDAAVLRGHLEGAKVVLGSATPSLETWRNVETEKYALAALTHRAGAGTLPLVQLVDMTAKPGVIFSEPLLEAVKLRLDRGEQTILFLNRRGYSRSVVCESCGFVISCPDCSVPYTYHQSDACLRCHICGGWTEVPKVCPACRATTLKYQGIGTQRAEAALLTCFRKARVLRMDADSTSRKNSHDDILSAFRRGEADILLGTQMIAKGLDFPNVTLVGVLNADSSLNLPDFRAAERTYQLVSQVAGRAGRAELPGEVLIQTYDPSQLVLQLAARGDFRAFATNELAARKTCDFPPFCHLAAIGLKSKDLSLVSAWADMMAKSLMKVKGLEVSEAVPSALEKAEGWYRWQIIVRAKSAAEIVRAWRWILAERPVPAALRVGIDIDAQSLM